MPAVPRQKADVSHPSMEHCAMMPAWTLLADVYAGSEAIRQGCSVYLPRHAQEPHEASRSVIVDFAAATVGAKVRWVSVLDGKTTAICRARSGKIYDAGSGPRPPAHARCRSIVVPYFEGKGDAEEPTYSDWLKKQTPERVRQILGKTKGDMFLDGTLSLEDMVTAKGRELTLKELAIARKARE